MSWTKEHPTAPGWWWLWDRGELYAAQVRAQPRGPHPDEPVYLECLITGDEVAHPIDSRLLVDALWAGPIDPPTPPEEPPCATAN